MKYFLIAGEASGDLHASNLMKALKRSDPGAEFRYMGGELMDQVAPGLIMHYRQTSFMFLDVLFHLGKIFRNLRRIKLEIRRWNPDVVIPVDYPGFNLRITRHVAGLGFRVFYFITPKVWAWKKRRVDQLKKYTRRLFVILPFEVPFYKQFGVDVEYFGNPLVDGLHEFMEGFEGKEQWKEAHRLDERPVVALLAGSRNKEIQRTLPVMVRIAADHPEYQFVVAGAPSIEPGFYSAFLEGAGVKIVFGETYALLASSFAGVITSGTATLEAALFRVPQVVVYRTGSLAYTIAKRIIKINFISLVNLILDRGLVVEVIQESMYEQAGEELSRILEDTVYRGGILDGYREMESMLGEKGVSGRIAGRMVELNTIGNRMSRSLVTVILGMMGMALNAQIMEVGLYQEQLVTRAVVYCSSGSYSLVTGDTVRSQMEAGGILYLTFEGGRIRVLDAERDYGHTDRVVLKAGSTDASFRIRPIVPELESRVYDETLVVHAGDRFITLVNRVDFDKYLAGVVETEAGPNAHMEFYKAQSILCRTYAMKHLDRHDPEGFPLCDGTHCQAYKGRSAYNPEILEAVLETTGMVVTDFNYRLITAAYHSNSGGQTQLASDVWITDADYLLSVLDPYSLHQPNAKWRDTISFGDWKDYLVRNGMESVGRIPDEILYVEQMKRKKYFVLDGDSIRMTKIREDWNFRSAFFDMFPDGDSVLVWGKGYGHGVGMSQEGAMKMARDGFSYEDILQFYFYQIRLMDYRDLPASSRPVFRPEE